MIVASIDVVECKGCQGIMINVSVKQLISERISSGGVKLDRASKKVDLMDI